VGEDEFGESPSDVVGEGTSAVGFVVFADAGTVALVSLADGLVLLALGRGDVLWWRDTISSFAIVFEPYTSTVHPLDSLV
jgi:hypothetical protein